MEQTVTQTETKTYQIAGRAFTVLPVVARQEKWLWPYLKSMFAKGESITADDIFSMMSESITAICAILLIPDGQTQPEKVRAGIDAVRALDVWLDETVTVSELGPVVADFFASGQQWKILTGLAGPLRPQPTSGSTTPSAPLPMATSSERSGSGSTPVSANAPATCNADGSAVPWKGLSLVSAE